MKHIFIINPIAGKGNLQDTIEKTIHNVLQKQNADYEVYISKHKGDIQNFIANKVKDNIQSVFYACGGDGTLHDVVNACVGYNNASVGVIPCGSGNDFIKNFDNYNNFLNVSAQIEGSDVFIDLIKVKDKYAASVCNIGLDADAAFHMHKFKKVPFISGSTRYLLSVFYCLLKKLGKQLEVVLDNNIKINGTYLLGVIANGHSYGGGYKCAPLAIINDGIMDLCFVNNLSRFKILSLIKSYKEGTHLTNYKLKDVITYKKCTHARIKSKEPINVCIDGESYVYEDIEFTVVNNALKLRLPTGVTVGTVLKCHIS